MDRWVVCTSCGATKRRQEFYVSRWGLCQPCAECCDQRVREAEEALSHSVKRSG